MPTKRDNDRERFARIEALMEEYRINHEDLLAYVQATRDRVRQHQRESRSGIKAARAAFKKSLRNRR